MSTDRRIRVLVTGATGFLGGNILQALQASPDAEPIAACRDKEKLPLQFKGEVRLGDMTDSRYRREVVRGVNVVCNAAAWASMWNHTELERRRFFEPSRDLIDQAMAAGVGRFIQASTVVIGEVTRDGTAHDDFSPTRYIRFWPHLDRLVDLDSYMKAQARPQMQMVTMRLGHFVGAGNRLGMLPALLPRLRTYLVPWLAGGRKRLPLNSRRGPR